MITAFVMAIAVRGFLHIFAERLTNPYLEVLAGGAVGAILYSGLFLLTERALLRKILELVRRRKMGNAPTVPTA